MIFKEIDVHKLNQLLKSKKDIILLDVRTDQEVLLSKIDQSIKDLSNHDYGFCENPNCGVEIGIRRLEARPTACLCIDCKTLEEITEKQQYG